MNALPPRPSAKPYHLNDGLDHIHDRIEQGAVDIEASRTVSGEEVLAMSDASLARMRANKAARKRHS